MVELFSEESIDIPCLVKGWERFIDVVQVYLEVPGSKLIGVEYPSCEGLVERNLLFYPDGFPPDKVGDLRDVEFPVDEPVVLLRLPKVDLNYLSVYLVDAKEHWEDSLAECSIAID